MKIIKETTKLNEDYASRIADIYDRDAEALDKVINQYMKSVGKLENWESPDVINMNVDEGLRKVLTSEEIIQLYRLINEGDGTDPRNVVGKIISLIIEDGSFDSVVSFDEASVMTRNKGFIVRKGNKTFQFELLGSGH